MITPWRTPVLLLSLLLSPQLYAASEPAAEARNGMVVSSQHLASQAGADILKAGGNAVDAAVAVGYAQAVVNPCCGNIGGGGFMTLHLADGKNIFINFRETAPASASADMYLDKNGNLIKDASLYGYLAAGVPGTVKGLDYALEKYGTMKREQVMAPAIKLARDGFILTRADTDVLDTTAELIMVGLPGAAGVSADSSGNDAAVSGKVREGYLYGANDVRRPAGEAAGVE